MLVQEMSKSSQSVHFHENRNLLTFWGMNAYAVMSLISMATMSLGAGVLIFCILFDQGGPRRLLEELKDSFQSPWLKSYLACSAFLILACVLSLASAQWFPLNFGGRIVSVHWLRDLGKVWYFFFPGLLLIAWRRLNERYRARVLCSWILCFGMISAIGVFQFFTGWPRPQPNPLLPGYFHTSLFLGHHLSVASIWIFPFFACLELVLLSQSATQRAFKDLVSLLSRKVLISFVVLGILTLILTYSRTLWVALPIGLVLWGIGRLPGKGKLTFGLMTGIILAGLSQLSIFQARFSNPMGIQTRIELWKANLQFFFDRPVFGVGLGKNLELSSNYFKWLHPESTDFFVGHAHNIYLEILAGLGVFGTLAWITWILWVLGGLIKLSRQKDRRQTFAAGMLIAWVILMLNGLTQVNFWEGKVLHQMMWQVGLIFSWVFPAETQDHRGEGDLFL